MKMMREAVLFSVAGIIGFMVDAGVLVVLDPYVGPYIGRGFSFFVAVTVTWQLNRTFAFGGRSSGLGKGKEFVAYLSLMLIGGVVNYLTFTWFIWSYPEMGNRLFIAVAAGSIAGMFFNFATARLSIFRRT